MPTTMLWKKFDCLTDGRVFLECSDDCYYARDYISHGRWDASECNNLISNFKKSVSRRGQPDWKYKGRAIRQFATELLTILGNGTVIAAIPTSKARNDPEYDSRLDDTLNLVVQANRNIRIEAPIRRTVSAQALHQGGRRSINDVLRTLEWAGFQQEPDHLVLIDDIITCGSNFKACQRLINARYANMPVVGVFWARTVWPAENDFEEVEEPPSAHRR